MSIPTPPGRGASPSHSFLCNDLLGFPNNSPVPIYTLGGERHCERNASRPRTQRNEYARGPFLEGP